MACEHCRGSLSVPEKYGRATIRCNWCEADATVPDHLRADPGADVTADVDEPFDPTAHYQLSAPEGAAPRTLPTGLPTVYRAKFEGKAGTGKPMLEGDRTETDDGPPTPYAVPGTGLKPCPECAGDLPLDATFCVHCGTPLVGTDRAKVRRKYKPIDETFHDGWAPAVRRNLMLAALAANAALVVVGVAGSEYGLRDGEAWVGAMASAAIPTLLQAFLLGTYGTLKVTRDRGGRAELWRTFRFAFVPMAPQKIPLDGCAGAGVVAAPPPGCVGLVVCLTLFAIGIPLALFLLFSWMRPGVLGTIVAVLMVGVCMLPGALFYMMVMRNARTNVALTDDTRGSQGNVLRSRTIDDARDVAKVVAEAAGLTWHKAL